MTGLLPERYAQCLRLNLRVAALAFRGRWLDEDAYAQGYDRVAPSYDADWLSRLRPVTDRLLSHLPAVLPPGQVLDLGCGTGYASQRLQALYPGRESAGVDLSARMLELARERLGGKGSFIQGDMLDVLRRQKAGSAALVCSAWAMGYSDPAAVIRESARLLASGGKLLFVVNLKDTLEPVFLAFRRCMASHPESVRRAVRVRFPGSWTALERMLSRAGLRVEWHEDGFQEVRPPPGEAPLDWLLRTGVLAGFDEVLPLREPGPAAERFAALLAADPRPLRHHYAAALAARP